MVGQPGKSFTFFGKKSQLLRADSGGTVAELHTADVGQRNSFRIELGILIRLEELQMCYIGTGMADGLMHAYRHAPMLSVDCF